jgi:hypothetical protein
MQKKFGSKLDEKRILKTAQREETLKLIFGSFL